jgi:hypothetical protein
VNSCRRAGGALLLCLALLAADTPGRGIEEIRLALGDIGGEGWSVEGVEARLVWLDDRSVTLQLNAAQARFPEPLGRLAGLRLECPRLTLSPLVIACGKGDLHLDYPGAESLRITVDYRLESGRLSLGVDGFRSDGGTIDAKLETQRERWKLALHGATLQLAGLSRRLTAAGALASPLSGPGTLGFAATLEGEGVRLRGGRVLARLRTGEFSDARGALAGAGLELGLDATLKPLTEGWRVRGALEGRHGQLYVDPLFIDFNAQPVHANAVFDWRPAARRLRIAALDYHQPGVVKLHAAGRIVLDRAVRVETLSVDITEGHLPGLYATYLQPWLNETALADLQTTGSIAASARWEQGRLTGVRAKLHDVGLDDRERRYGLGGLEGRLDWSADNTPRRSELRWRDGHLFRVPLGEGRLVTESTASSLRLRQPARIGVLDGALQVDAFELDFPADSPWGWHFDSILTPVSLPLLCRSLGWPEFAGKLSGVIPDVRYVDGRLEVGGMLLVRAFDGEITLDRLRLLQPLSPVPRLRVDARVHDIDLKALTGAFSFGRIEGRLDGRVEGLDMEAWRPVAFDAAFATPAGDTSRHRISQKAVDNISSIGGGGVGGVLSRSILRFFKDFPYDKLGIRCRLEHGVCEMGGVAPAPGGYYLVKGRFLPPRLDVIGYAERVNWRSLVSQLAAVTRRQGGAAVQ